MTSVLADGAEFLVGVREPRVRVVPPGASRSQGADAIELAASAGLHLDGWQQDDLCDLLAEESPGRWAQLESGLVVPRQNGKGGVAEAIILLALFVLRLPLVLYTAHEFKALDVSTPMLTRRGWRTMGDLVAGDEVFGPDGQPTKVVAAHPVRRDRPCYVVRFDDGQEIVADAEHLWEVFDVVEGRRRVLTTSELGDGGVAKVTRREVRPRRVYRWRVDIPGPMVNPDAALPVDPWLLGAWLGDGTSAKGELTVGRQDLEYMLGELDRLGETYKIRADRRHPDVLSVTVVGLAGRLRALGVLGNKRIPAEYMVASVPQRRALLAGIMDTDGTVSLHRIAVTMVKGDLMREVVSLVRSLGYKATLREFRARLNGQDAGPMYRVTFTSAQAVSPFRIPRKTALLKPREMSVTRAHYNAIVAIDPVESRPVRCITVAHESACYLAGAGFVPTHNTARELFLRVVGRIEDTPELDGLVAKVSWSHGDEGIELRKGAGGCRLRIIARSKGSGRGFSAPLSILDEAMFVTAEQVAALMPTMSAMPNPLLVVLGSAGFSTSSYLHRLRGRALSGRPGRVCYLDHSVDPGDWGGRDSLLWQEARADRRVWAVANPAIGIRLGVEILEMEFAAMEPEVFDRERLGVFDPEPASAGADAVLDLGQWVERGDPSSEPVLPEVAIVVEVGRKGSTSAIALGGMREDGRRHVELLDYRPGTGWLEDRRAELEELYPDAVWCIDSSGPSVMLRSRADWEELPPKAVSEAFAELVAGVVEDRLVWRCAEVDAPAVLTAAEHGVAHTTGDGVQRWSRTKSGVDITPLIALTFAGWAGEYLAVNGDPLRAIR